MQDDQKSTCRTGAGRTEAGSCRVGLRPPFPSSPEEEIRGRSGVRIVVGPGEGDGNRAACR
jgi:hypothetical protein